MDHLERDLGAAAYLLAKGFRLLRLAPQGRGRYSFRFADPEGHTAEASLGYFQGDSVSAKALVAAEKNLKTLLYTKKETENGNAYRESRL